MKSLHRDVIRLHKDSASSKLSPLHCGEESSDNSLNSLDTGHKGEIILPIPEMHMFNYLLFFIDGHS